MKKYTILFILAFMHNVLCAQMSPHEQFLRAQQQCSAGDYAGAFAVYKDLSTKSAATWCGMGNCNYQLGNHAQALACWRKAQLTANRAEFADVAYNIQLLETQGVSHEQPRALRWYHKLGWLRALLPFIVWQLLFLSCWLALVLGGARFYRTKRYIGLTLLALLLGISGLVLASTYAVRKQGTAIVLQPQVTMFAGPDEHYHALAELREGDEVIVEQREGLWYKVQGEKAVGWILRDVVEVID